MAITYSPNMNLQIPSVGTEPGPDYAQDVNNSLNIIDGHDHSPGYGTPVTPAGMNINSDLSMLGNDLTSVRTIRFQSQGTAPAGPLDLGCLYEVGNDLYFTDGTGVSVRITQSGAVAGTPGSIANLVSPASASYSVASKTFIFQSDALTPGNIDGASIVLRNLVASSYGLTLSPPTLASDTSITLPPIPASKLPVVISSSGVMTAEQITLAQLSATLQGLMNSIAPGLISAYGGAAAPTGYLLCDGSAVSRTTYAALFSAIGTAYGIGDGSSTFNVPDLRGQFLRGVTGASANDPDAASRTATNSGNSGNNVGSVQGYQVQSHNHTFSSTVTVTPAGNAYNAATPPLQYFTNGNTSSTGGNETRPTNVYVNFIIKT